MKVHLSDGSILEIEEGDEDNYKSNPRYWKYCGYCGERLTHKYSVKPIRFDRITGTASYYVYVQCPSHSYTSTSHTVSGYETNKPEEI